MFILLLVIGIIVFIGLMWIGVKISLKSIKDSDDFEEEEREDEDGKEER